MNKDVMILTGAGQIGMHSRPNMTANFPTGFSEGSQIEVGKYSIVNANP